MTSILICYNMDFIQKYSVKIPNAVIVDKVTGLIHDEEVIDFLKKYGSIQRTVLIDDVSTEFHKNLIVEFSGGSAVEGLEPLLPYRYTLKDDSYIVYNIQTLSSVYSFRLGSSATKNYLTELKELAKLSGKDYEAVLREMMTQISSDVESMQSAPEPSPLALSETPEESPPFTSPLLGPPQDDNDVTIATVPITVEKRVPSLSVSDVNPPEIQKVVVEHIVRREDIGSFSSTPVRLRSFSGKTPRPNNEADYDTWRSHIELLLNDPSMSSLQVSRRILESLLSPAADVVKGLSSNSLPSAYLQLLDSAFGVVEDGEELFAQFMNTLQDPGEKPSTYLQRLQLALNQAVKRGGVAPGEVGKHLLKQFCRGCWDSVMLSGLQLEQKKNSPPSFSELLLMLRTEEDRQAAKASRMRKHVGSTKHRVQLQSQSGCVLEPAEDPKLDPSGINDLRKQVASLQSQLTTLMAQKKSKGFGDRGATEKTQGKVFAAYRAKSDTAKQPRKNYTNKPRPWYCFNCGGDGHISTSCTNDSNPTLVTEKRRLLEERQRVWEQQNNPHSPLN